MKSLVATAILVAVSIGWCDGYAGWIGAWHAYRGAAALERGRSPSGSASDAEIGLVEFGRAVDANPLSDDSRRGYVEAAEAAFTRLGPARTVQNAPRGTVARSLLAEALERRGDRLDAGAVRAGITSVRPEEIELLPAAALRDLGVASAIAGRCDVALPLLDAAVARGTNDLQMQFQYAVCLYKTGEIRRALPELAVAYLQNPSRSAQALLAEAHLRLGDLSEADEMIQALTARERDFYYGWRVRGDVLAAMGRWRQAADSYQRAFALRPENDWLRWRIRRMNENDATAGAAGDSVSPATGCSAGETAPCS